MGLFDKKDAQAFPPMPPSVAVKPASPILIKASAAPIEIKPTSSNRSRTNDDELPELLLGDPMDSPDCLDGIPADPSHLRHQRRGTLSNSVEVNIGCILQHKRNRQPSEFDVLKVLGAGAYGKVMLVRDASNGKLYAQKQLKKASIVIEQRMIDMTMSERQILEVVRHPYIVKLHYAIQDSHKLYLILQYAEGGELFTHLAAERMFSEDCAAYYGAQAVCALFHLHQAGIVYRDLKPENCLLDSEGNLLLTDFGLSKIAEGDATCSSMLGTPEYMAPEVLLGEPYDYTVDWWSLGALLFDFMTGNPPFTGATHQRVINKIVGMKYKPNLPYYLSTDAKDLLRRLLKKEPEKRLGYKQMDVIKKHRFFRKLNWDDIETKSSRLDPPIKPIISDPELAENFSTEFTCMALSPETLSAGDPRKLFEGFSYGGSIPRELAPP